MFTEARNARIRYEMQGDAGSRIVLLHGWGCSGEMMKTLAEGLAQEHRTLRLDFPGHGESSRPPEPWGVPEYAACLRETLEKLDFLPCAVIAHSFGCQVAAWAASEWPDMFTRMILTGAAGLTKPPTEEGKRRSAAYQRGRKIARAVEKIPFLRAAGERMEEGLRQKYGSADYKALDPEMRQTFVKVIGLDLRDRYPLIRQSTLLIWGDQDTETPLWMGREMEKLIPDAGLVMLEGGSHFAYLEQAGRFLSIAKHFLTEENG